MTIEAVEQIQDTSMTTDQAAEAMLKSWGITEDEKDGESPSESSEDTTEESTKDPSEQDDESQQTEDGDATDEDGEDSEEDDEESTDEEDSDDEDTDEEQEPSVAHDDAKVTVEVNGESKEFTVGDLKRLAGQEAALTTKSQEVAEYRKRYDEGLTAQRTALEAMVQRAAKRFEPYKDFDFALAAQQYDPETYKALKEDAQAAYADLEFYQKDLSRLVQKQDQERQEELQRQANEALKILKDPEEGIPGFNRDMYVRLRDYGIDAGISPSDMDAMVHPAAWKMLHKAMEYDRVQKAQDGARPAKRKVKKVVKTTKTNSSAKVSKERAGREEMRDLASKSGLDSIEAAANALVKGWQS